MSPKPARPFDSCLRAPSSACPDPDTNAEALADDGNPGRGCNDRLAGSRPEKTRRDMLRFAQLQLRDAGAAEDMVQEALLAAMKYESSFAGRSSLKTWLFSILRNKILDHLKKSAREISGSELVIRG